VSHNQRSRWGGLLRLLRLPIKNWLLAVEAALELMLMKVLVLLVPPARYGWLVAGPAPGSTPSWSKEAVRDLVWAVESVGQYASKTFSCLPRALALQRMLCRRGLRGTVRFGVKKHNGVVLAHAWLVLDGYVLIGRLADLEEYMPFPEWPKTSSKT